MLTLRLPALIALLALSAHAQGPSSPEKPFRERLKDPINSVRFHAARQPPESLSIEDVAALCGALKDVDTRVREAAVEGLQLRGTQAGEAGAKALAGLLLDPMSGLQVRAAYALVALRDGAYQALLPTLKEPDTLVAAQPWMLLAMAGREETAALLLRAVKSAGDPAVRAQAALVLRRCRLATREVVAELWPVVLGDAPAPVRAAVIRAYGTLLAMFSAARRSVDPGARDERVKQAIPVLREQQSDPDEAVKEAAKAAVDALEAEVKLWR